MTKQQSVKEQLEELEKIVQWFEGQKEVDVEEGLRRMKEAKELILTLNQKLKAVENEFEEVKKSLSEE